MFTHFAPGLILPEVLKPIWRKRSVPRGVLDILVSQVSRHRGEAADSSSEIPSLAGCSGGQLINFGEE
jgi:hypothetical protein